MRKALAQRFVNDQVSGKSVKEREEGERHIRRKVTQIFYDSIVPDMKKKQKCETDEEFYAFLEKSQMTLQTLQNDYAETMLARQCINENVPEKPSAELIDLAEYYDDHIDDFKKPAKARFQILTAEFSKHPSKEAAFGAIAEMGNQVIGGRPFETVARSMSNGYAASEGGYYDWTTQSALKSKVIDEVVFSIEPQKLSQIKGLHAKSPRDNTCLDKMARRLPWFYAHCRRHWTVVKCLYFDVASLSLDSLVSSFGY
jgi:hypothetical protein